MEHQSSTTGPQDLKKDRSKAQEGAVQRPQGAGPQPAAQPNGAGNGLNGTLPNGVAHAGGSNAMTNGGPSESSTDGPPTPLDQSWRREASNSSMGKLMERVAQWCYNDLNTLINDLAQQVVPPQSAQANGAVLGEDTDQVSLSKKRKLMDFANTQRDRFIRALVISDWSRNADDIANVIDINLLLRKNDFCVADAIQRIGQMKIDGAGAKMPNPNIDLAMELLSTGKAHAAPDFGYLPPKKIAAKELLKIMKETNVTLATRLALHEEIPSCFRSYSIANGRATFVVPDEFEVDLTVIDDEPTSTFFFIDIRFLFSPSPTSLEPDARSKFEVEVNRSIMLNGLQGCYEILHEFVLTHKIDVLAQQARELQSGKWFNCIGVERMRRNLVLSYWVGRAGPKSWLEFGVASGKVKGGSGRKPTTPCISLRWFQQGVEVKDVKLEIDWHLLSVESILSQAIAKHASVIMASVEEGLRSFAAGDSSFLVDSHFSDSDPDECALRLKLPSLRNAVCVQLQPVTGLYSIGPSSTASDYTQKSINQNANADAPRRLASMLCEMSLERVQNETSNMLWRQFTKLERQDNLAALFGADFWHWRLYLPTMHWGEEWAVAITLGLSGNKWWIVRLADSPTSNDGRKVLSIARPLSIGDAEASRISLLRIERLAMAEVSFTAAELQLRDAHIAFYLERPALTSSDKRSARTAMYLPFSKLMRDTRVKDWKPWAHELVRLTHHGRERRATDTGALRVRHDIRMTLKKEFMKQLHKHVEESKDRNMGMNKTAGFALRFYTAFGASFVDGMRARLASFKRLDQHVTTLTQLGLQCTTVNLSRLEFTYSSSPLLTTCLTLSSSGNTKLALSPRDTNPHHRLRIQLEHLLNNSPSDPSKAFGNFAHTLLFSLPVLSTFESLNLLDPKLANPILHLRAPLSYTLKYKQPYPAVTFTLRARSKMEKGRRCVKWCIEQERTKAGAESLPEGLIGELRGLWTENGAWVGVGSGLVTDVKGIADAMRRVDGVVRRYENGGAGNGNGSAQPAAVDIIAVD